MYARIKQENIETDDEEQTFNIQFEKRESSETNSLEDINENNFENIDQEIQNDIIDTLSAYYKNKEKKRKMLKFIAILFLCGILLSVLFSYHWAKVKCFFL